MTVFGISMVKNEDDIIETTIQHTLNHVDHIIIADNLSTDNTRSILDSFGENITVVDDDEVGYYQSRKMTALAHQAAEMGADWVVPFDADEIWFSPHFPTIKEHLESVPDEYVCVVADWYHHSVTTFDDQSIENPFKRMRYHLVEKAEMCKVAARCDPKLVIEQGNHGIQYGGPFMTYDVNLEARHFPYRSPEQFMRKVTQGSDAYKASNLEKHLGSHWKMFAREIKNGGVDRGEEIFATFVMSDSYGLIDDPAPIRWLS